VQGGGMGVGVGCYGCFGQRIRLFSYAALIGC